VIHQLISFNKEGKMEKKYLKKVLTGLSIASLVSGIGGFAVGASG
jgi:radical SAM modification target selenobiotic family peptide